MRSFDCDFEFDSESDVDFEFDLRVAYVHVDIGAGVDISVARYACTPDRILFPVLGISRFLYRWILNTDQRKLIIIDRRRPDGRDKRTIHSPYTSR